MVVTRKGCLTGTPFASYFPNLSQMLLPRSAARTLSGVYGVR